MLQLGHIAGADDQAHQTNQIGQGIAEAQMVKRLRQLIAGQAEMAQGVARAHQHRGGGHGACQHTGGEPDIPAETTLPSIMAISIALPTITSASIR